MDNSIEAAIRELSELARQSHTFENFSSRLRQAHLTDLSNPTFHRWGRAIPVYADEPYTDLLDILRDRHNPGSYHETIKYEAPEVYRAINRAVHTGQITMYRAVPREIQGPIQIGDYVALDPEYARGHARQVIQGEQGRPAKILKKTVPLEDVVWGDADFNEWAYSPKTLRESVRSLEDLYGQVHRKVPG